jgi:glycosyltransferase involved in cell wall biosynthesis
LSEGVGSSQILPLLQRLSKSGLRVNLISFEKLAPSVEIQENLKLAGVDWNIRHFRSNGARGGIARLLEISTQIPETRVIHARSDISAVAASISRKAPILWDVRSLWADQRAFIETNPIMKRVLKSYGVFEGIASSHASAMSTLTHAVVPVLEVRHKHLPSLRIVVPTAVDLQKFKFNPNIPASIRGLFSGTYNEYYDLVLSKKFINSLKELSNIDVHWARPQESHRHSLEAGETSIFIANQNEMADIISNYSFGISICKIDAGPSLKAAMPTKIAEFLACGRPVVLNAGLGDFNEYIREFNAGVLLDGTPGDLEVKARQFMDILVDPQTSMRCRALAEKYFDMDQGAEKYLSLYSQM